MKTYIAIDLKSFYASVECVERGLDPLNTNLVVADNSRTEKTICLAVSPSLKSFGIPGRARLYEVISKVKEVNRKRQLINRQPFLKSSYYFDEINNHKNYGLDYIVAKPRMNLYIEYSSKIYQIYLKYIAAEDIHVYSIDEVFIDVTSYLKNYKMTARELAMKMVKDVLNTTGITATVGIGTNLYLAKVAMDIVAKHLPADENGVRIAVLDEKSYRELLWDHQPLTDFWRVGKGISKRLNDLDIYTMGDLALKSLENEKTLFDEFGIIAELLIDHAWGIEPCEMKNIKQYKPQNKSLCVGQVLKRPYNFEETKLIVKEMTDLLVLELVKKKLVTGLIDLHIGYDIVNLKRNDFSFEVKEDFYGRKVPKSSHSSKRFEIKTSSSKAIMAKMMELFDEICDPGFLVRRINISFNNLVSYDAYKQQTKNIQVDLFNQKNIEQDDTNKEKNLQEAIINIKEKYGKNAILKGNNLSDGATAVERNEMVGGHKG